MMSDRLKCFVIFLWWVSTRELPNHLSSKENTSLYTLSHFDDQSLFYKVPTSGSSAKNKTVFSRKSEENDSLSFI